MSDGNWQIEAVRAFHLKHGHAAPERFTPMPRELALFRLRLMLEELKETAAALGFGLCGVETGDDVEVRSSYKYLTAERELHVDGIGQGFVVDWAEVIDGLEDLEYVTLGTKVSMGVRDNRFFKAVADSNDTKPVKDEADPLGKPAKDQGYQPPPIAYLLERLKERGR